MRFGEPLEQQSSIDAHVQKYRVLHIHRALRVAITIQALGAEDRIVLHMLDERFLKHNNSSCRTQEGT